MGMQHDTRALEKAREISSHSAGVELDGEPDRENGETFFAAFADIKKSAQDMRTRLTGLVEQMGRVMVANSKKVDHIAEAKNILAQVFSENETAGDRLQAVLDLQKESMTTLQESIMALRQELALRAADILAAVTNAIDSCETATRTAITARDTTVDRAFGSQDAIGGFIYGEQ
jgi:hypothetical protein